MKTTSAQGSAERVGLDPSSPWFAEHVARYRFAAPWVADRRVLDIACGSGLGHRVLKSAGAAEIVGMDVTYDGLQTAREVEVDSGLCQADAHAIPLRDASMDTVVTFETIEHLNRPEVFVEELQRVITPGGTLLLSTPNALFTRPPGGVPRNPFHLREYTPDELVALLGRFFTVDDLTVQRVDPALGPSPYWSLPEWLPTDPVGRARVVAWKIQNKLPLKVKDRISRALQGHPFYPTEQDFIFSSTDLERGHVLMARCTV